MGHKKDEGVKMSVVGTNTIVDIGLFFGPTVIDKQEQLTLGGQVTRLIDY